MGLQPTSQAAVRLNRKADNNKSPKENVNSFGTSGICKSNRLADFHVGYILSGRDGTPCRYFRCWRSRTPNGTVFIIGTLPTTETTFYDYPLLNWLLQYYFLINQIVKFFLNNTHNLFLSDDKMIYLIVISIPKPNPFLL